MISQTYTNTDTDYIKFSYKVNDPSGNIKLKILNDNQDLHLNIDYFKVVTFPVADPDAPTNVTTAIAGGNITIGWDAVSGATSYDVYSSDDPYSGYSFEANVLTNEYTVSTTAAKKFYYIVSKND